MQSLLDDLELKIKELIDFYISLGYYSNIYEFVPEEILSNDIRQLYKALEDIDLLRKEYPEFLTF